MSTNGKELVGGTTVVETMETTEETTAADKAATNGIPLTCYIAFILYVTGPTYQSHIAEFHVLNTEM